MVSFLEPALDGAFEFLTPVGSLEIPVPSLGLVGKSSGSSSTTSPWVAGKNMQSSFGWCRPGTEGIKNYVPPKFFVMIIFCYNKSPKRVSMLLG
jgi:hypothetical protein